MKTLVKLFQLIAIIGLLFACSDTSDFYGGDGLEPDRELSKNNSQRGLDQDRYVTMKSTGMKVHYRIIGKGPIDVVFIPGWTNPLTVYTKQFDYFRDKARCIYIDLPGTGLSDAPTPNTPLAPIPDGPEYTMELMADAVYTVVKKEGLHKFVGVGFSMGPIVLGMFERNYPGMIYKLVAIDGAFNPWPTTEPERQNRIDARQLTYLNQLTWDAAMKESLAGILAPPLLTPQDLQDFATYFYVFPSDILANTLYHANAENANVLVDWTYPKLCLFANPPTQSVLDAMYPNNTVHPFPGGGHVIHWVFHEDINPLIWEFIADRPGNKY